MVVVELNNEAVDSACNRHELLAQYTYTLNELGTISLLINRIRYTPNRLLDLIQDTPQPILKTLKRFAGATDWTLLIDIFLIKEEQDLPPNRWKLINFLRSDWQRQLNLLSTNVNKEANRLFIRCIRILTGDEDHVPEEVFTKLTAFCAEYLFALDKGVAHRLISFYVEQFAEKNNLNVAKEFIHSVALLFSTLTAREQKEVISALSSTELSVLIAHCMKYCHLVDVAHQANYQYTLLVIATHCSTLKEEMRITIQQLLNPFAALNERSLHAQGLSLLKSNLASAEVTINELILRYKCFIFTLPNDELLAFFEGYKVSTPFIDKVLYSIKQLEQHSGQDDLFAKKQRLLQWGVERIFHTLMQELIRQYQQEHNREALTVIYTFYSKHYAPLRADLRTLIIAFNEDESINVERTFSPYLYNQQGKIIAFLDEENKVWDMLGDEPVLFLRKEPFAFYNKDGACLGRVNDFGYLEQSTPTKRSFNRKDKEPLNRSALIVHDLLIEQGLVSFYQQFDTIKEDDRVQRLAWEQILVHELKNASYPITCQALNVFVCHCSPEIFFPLWVTIKNSHNAHALFHTILNHVPMRELLFSAQYLNYFQQFLKYHNEETVLSDYLISHYKQPWFTQGLLLFYKAVENEKGLCLVSTVLKQLHDKAHRDELAITVWNDILFSLIQTKEAAAFLVQQIGQDDFTLPVQQIRINEFEQILNCFDKQHVLFLVKQLVDDDCWGDNPLYRLALFILQRQHDSLLQKRDIAWPKEELILLINFINRHLQEKNHWDSQLLIGYKLLGAILFHCAAGGLTDLFLSGSQKLSPLVTYTGSPILLAQLAHQFNLGEARQRWHTLCESTAHRVKKNIPLICVYLLHYKGPVPPLAEMLHHYIGRYAHRKALVYPVSAFLTSFPHLTVSACIFDALQSALITNPQILDLTLLQHMAHYYGRLQNHRGNEVTKNALLLLTYWGQAKNYDLVQYGCVLLLSAHGDVLFQKKLIQIKLEARIEKELEQRSQSPVWYNNLINKLKRFYHYGLKWEQNSSQVVAFHEELSTPVSPVCTVADIVVPSEVQEEDDSYKQFMHLLIEVMRSSSSCVQEQLTTKLGRQALFAPSTKPLPILDEVASQPDRAYV